MNHQFMFNGRQDFEQNFLILTLILTWLGWGGGDIFYVPTFIEQ